MADDFKRITVRSLKDTSSGAYSIAEYDKDVQAIERALKSALPKDAFYHKSKEINYNDPTFHQIGKLREDFYIKEGYTRVAQEAIDQALSKMLFKGSADPKYWATRTRALSDKENETIKELEKLALNKGKEASGDSEGFRFRKSTLIKMLALLTTLTDITRRILSSVLNISAQQVKDTIEAHNLGISREQLRDYRRTETAHGMKEGTIAEALAGEQQKYGNITSLDEKSLEYIALIMGDKVAKMATMGLGASNPEAIVGAIVDRANELANAGYNSVGQYVGEMQARRELYSYLLKYSPQIADIFATMQEEQHNINSIFRNQVDTFEKFKNSTGIQRGTTQAGEGVLITLGQEWNVLKQVLDDIKHALAVSIAPYLTRILRRLNNMRVGMSESEKLRLNAENRDANTKALKETEASIEYLEAKAGGNVNRLSKTDRAYYDTLVQYKKDLVEENNKKEIDNIVRTGNELKAEQERRIRGNAKFLKTILLSGEVDLDDPRYKDNYSFSNAEIMQVIESQGTGSYGKSAYNAFKETWVKSRIEELRKTNKGMPENALRAQAENESAKAFARRYSHFFYPILLDLQADTFIRSSYNDQEYDIDRAREKWGAHFENLPSALPDKALGTHKLYSVDVQEGTETVHKLILDLNDNGVDKGDYEIASWWGNDRGGASGSQATLTYDKDKGITVQSLGTPASVTNSKIKG
jgi:hypothetical protein